MLTQRMVDRVTKPGRYRDRNGMPGLLLQVSASGAKSWLLRYVLGGTERMLGLGGANVFTLKEARERARLARQHLADGRDPLLVKRADAAAAKAAAARHLSFENAANRYAAQHDKRWNNANHRGQFLSSLRTYAFPTIGDLDVSAIDTALVLKCVEPIWTTKTTTADRVRNRIEGVLDWATVRGHRAGDNPARWKGHLDQVLPARGDIAKIQHHPALAYAELPQFMVDLERRESLGARALKFTILTAARTGEVIGATWNEIDLDNATWTIPAQRTKARREHRVPLSPAVIELLQALPREDGNPFVFIGGKVNGGLSHLPMLGVLSTMGRTDITVHGFRSTFRDWAAEVTAYPNHVVEQGLAHAVGNAVERAYRRSDLFDKRRKLMEDWGRYCTQLPATGDVVPIRGRQ
jgi:integrase